MLFILKSHVNNRMVYTIKEYRVNNTNNGGLLLAIHILVLYDPLMYFNKYIIVFLNFNTLFIIQYRIY